MLPSKQPFSQRHPVITGLLLMMVAMALLAGGMATYKNMSGSGALAAPRLGFVRIEGMILDTRKTMDWVKTLREDASVKGVLVRVDSPGGAVAPSQELHDAIKLLAAEKPVVVSMGSVAASGGLMVSTGATRIVANPATLTGSIGVKMEMPQLQGLMEKLGVGRQTLVSGDLKDAGSPFRPLTEHERTYLQSIIMEMYGQFVRSIAEDRDIPEDKVRSFADGRVITGSQAVALGLVDVLGSQEVALDHLRELCHMPRNAKVTLLEQPKERSFMRDLLEAAMELQPVEQARIPSFLYVW